MSWPAILWSLGSGVSLALAAVHLLVWMKYRDSWANLCFFVAAFSSAVASMLELAMMHAHTAQEYGELLRWFHLPLGVLVISLVWFVRFYLGTGRIWMIWLICGIRVLILVLNFFMSPNVNFIEITSLDQFPFLGEILAVPVGETNPWSYLAEGSGILLFILVLDAGISARRVENCRKAGVVCGTIGFASFLGVLLSLNLDLPIVQVPYTDSLVFLIIVLGLSYELGLDLINARQLARELSLTQDRMILAACAANMGLWDWDLVRDEIWANDVSRGRVRGVVSNGFTFERFLQKVLPEDREATRQAFLRSVERDEDLAVEYRLVQHGGAVQWVAATGKVERGLNHKPLHIHGVSMDITKRKIAEDVLFKSERLARVLLNNAHAFIHLLEVDGTVVDLNEPMAQRHGRSREELIGTNIFDHYPPEVAARRKGLLRQAALERKSVRFEDQGQFGIYDVIITPVGTRPEEKVQLVVFVQDITERRLAEQALQISEDKFRSLMEQAPDPVVVWNADGSISEFNQAWVDLWGFSASALPGIVEKYNIFQDKKNEENGSQSALRKVFSGESKFLSLPAFLCAPPRDAKKTDPHWHGLASRWIAPYFYPVKGHDGQVLYVVNVQENITERKEAEKKLKESEARIKDAHRIARLGTWELDTLTNQVIWSDEFLHLLKINRDKLDSSFESFLPLVHEKDREVVREHYLQLCRTHETNIITFRLLQPDGRVQYLQGQCEPYCNPQGQPLRCVGTVQDITDHMTAQQERMELKYELAHLDRLLTMNELSTSLAHEINQPLGAIMNNAAAAKTLCSRLEEGSEEIVEILEDVIRDTNRAGQIVRKVRGIVKKEEAVPEYGVLDMQELVDEVMELLKNTLRLHYINVHLERQPDLFPVRGDRVRLQQVLVNLMINSVTAMRSSPKKELTIRLNTQSSDELVVSVSDTGPGIDASIRETLFTPFITTKKGGLGIGLRICRSIIEDHGGRIWLENDTEEGATFSFSLNANQEEVRNEQPDKDSLYC